MIPSRTVFVVLPLLTAFVGCSTTAPQSTEKSQASAAGAGAQKDYKNEEVRFPVAALKVGLAEDLIIKNVGEPESVEQVPNSGGKAKILIYRRVIGTTMREVVGGTQEVPVFAGVGVKGDAIKMVSESVMRKEVSKVYEITKLLIWEGKYVSYKQAAETENRFAD